MIIGPKYLPQPESPEENERKVRHALIAAGFDPDAPFTREELAQYGLTGEQIKELLS